MQLANWFLTVDHGEAAKQDAARKKGRAGQAHAQHLAAQVAARRRRRTQATASRRRNRGW